MSALKKQFFWYMAGVTSFVIPMGIQTILFPWLVAVQLQESADRLGIAQMSTQLPGLFLILFGGYLPIGLINARYLLAFMSSQQYPPLG